jgi:hypothetical protein
MAHWFLRLAVIYGMAGIGLGLYMAASGSHTMHPVHAHLNLLGWVTLALFGLFYRAFPAAADTGLAKAHFWLFVPALLVQMITLAMLYGGNGAIEPVLATASFVVGAGFLCFAGVVWRATGAGVSESA